LFCDSDTETGNEVCYFEDVSCDKLTLSDYFEIKLGEYTHYIMLESLTATAKVIGREDCDLFITPLNVDETMIRLGDPFFVSFMPAFDVENDQLGLALSSSAPDGSSIVGPDSTVQIAQQ
jgi:hypothetical protein